MENTKELGDGNDRSITLNYHLIQISKENKELGVIKTFNEIPKENLSQLKKDKVYGLKGSTEC